MKIKVVPLAAESLGVRSMSTYVETSDVRILIDPGASLGLRFGLLPHPREYQALREARARLANHADSAQVVTISHYHYDHATPTHTDYLWNLSDFEVARQLYQDKLILGKDHRSMVNPSQRKRGWILKERIEKFVKSFEPADGRSFTYGDTSLRFSDPVPHGERDTPLGWVVMVSIKYCGEVFVHASDIQGPIVAETVDTLLASRPELLYLGGPPTYLLEYRLRKEVASKAFQNMTRIAAEVPILVVDHHLLREEAHPEGYAMAVKAAEKEGHRLITAAQFLGLENSFLESRRKELYREYPPSKEFLSWTRLPELERLRTRPPS